MINLNDGFFAPSGAIYSGGPSTWHIIDWDQRQLVSVIMNEKLESEDPAIEQLIQHIDSLPPNVYAIHVSPNGEFISISTDPKEDETPCVYYPPLNRTQYPENLKIVTRSDLEESDRLGPKIELVVCPHSPEPNKKGKAA
ncbi:hypothetical protein V8C42DRAFT_343489 [Trichoderma barbatum]